MQRILRAAVIQVQATPVAVMPVGAVEGAAVTVETDPVSR
ncbi:hypothetical protein GCM10009104_07870 [Marinobacterium maritimum]|uniref:Uncharacterized protein n=1 Tax=Marinobacterium maritimum TaxID=500162 RepID=A0ABP3TAN3_9GAMM